MKVEQYIAELIKREGGYVNHPNDRGGPTMFGITEVVARAYGYHGRMSEMPISMAHAIYLDRYWVDPKFHRVNEHSAALAEELLDTGVNMGPKRAAMFLQRGLNVLNRQGKLFPDLAQIDGNLGPLSIAALRAYLGNRGKDGETVLVRLMNAFQAVRYVDIAEANPTQEDFMHGWILHRVGQL